MEPASAQEHPKACWSAPALIRAEGRCSSKRDSGHNEGTAEPPSGRLPGNIGEPAPPKSGSSSAPSRRLRPGQPALGSDSEEGDGWRLPA